LVFLHSVLSRNKLRLALRSLSLCSKFFVTERFSDVFLVLTIYIWMVKY
jgi:hypothetical protein